MRHLIPLLLLACLLTSTVAEAQSMRPNPGGGSTFTGGDVTNPIGLARGVACTSISLYDTLNPDQGLNLTATNVDFCINNALRMTLDADGAGFGTVTNPAFPLQVTGTSVGAGSLLSKFDGGTIGAGGAVVAIQGNVSASTATGHLALNATDADGTARLLFNDATAGIVFAWLEGAKTGGNNSGALGLFTNDVTGTRQQAVAFSNAQNTTLYGLNNVIGQSSSGSHTVNGQIVLVGSGTDITTTGNENLVLDPAGAGAIGLAANTDITGVMTVSSTSALNGAVTVNTAAGTDAVIAETGVSKNSGSTETITFTNPGAGTLNTTTEGSATATGFISSGATSDYSCTTNEDCRSEALGTGSLQNKSGDNEHEWLLAADSTVQAKMTLGGSSTWVLTGGIASSAGTVYANSSSALIGSKDNRTATQMIGGIAELLTTGGATYGLQVFGGGMAVFANSSLRQAVTCANNGSVFDGPTLTLGSRVLQDVEVPGEYRLSDLAVAFVFLLLIASCFLWSRMWWRAARLLSWRWPPPVTRPEGLRVVAAVLAPPLAAFVALALVADDGVVSRLSYGDPTINAVPGTMNLDPQSTQINLTNSDPDGCVVTVQETSGASIGPGAIAHVSIVSDASSVPATNVITFPDVANVWDGQTLCSTTGINVNGHMSIWYADKADDMWIGESCTTNQ